MRASTIVPTSPITRLCAEKTAADRLRKPPSSLEIGRRKTGKLFDSPCASTTVTKAPARARQRGSRDAVSHAEGIMRGRMRSVGQPRPAARRATRRSWPDPRGQRQSAR